MTYDDLSSEDIFERIRTSARLFVYFSIPQCSVCTVLLPKVRALMQDHPDVAFLYVDSQVHPDVAGQHMVFAAPTLLFFAAGREQARHARLVSLEQIADAVERLEATPL